MSTPVSRGRLLVVDDEVELTRALCESLTEEGFEVRGLSDLTEAPDALRAGEFDILLSDLMRRHVEAVLRRHGGNKVQAAKALGVSRRTLYRLIEKYRIGAGG